MHQVPRLRTKVDGKKAPAKRVRNRPVPESPPEPLQCEHCLGKNVFLHNCLDCHRFGVDFQIKYMFFHMEIESG